MKISEAVALCDNMKPNQYTTWDKVRWLSDVEGMIWEEIVLTHEGGPEAAFAGYGEETPMETELLAGAPYADLYVKYLLAQVDFNSAEYARYNNSALMFNAAYTAFANYYNRTHAPKNRAAVRL